MVQGPIGGNDVRICRLQKLIACIAVFTMICNIIYAEQPVEPGYITPDIGYSYEVIADGTGKIGTTIIDVNQGLKIKSNNEVEVLDYLEYAAWLRELGEDYKYIDLRNTTYAHVSTYRSITPITQWDTGKYSKVNCVPTVCAVLTNWCSSGKSSLSPNTFRFLYPPQNSMTGMYNLDELDRMYTSLGLRYTKKGTYQSPTVFLGELCNGRIISMVVDMSMLPTAKDGKLTGHTYSGGGQHNIICTGYIDVKSIKGERIYLEIYDPAEESLLPRYYDVEDFKKTLSTYNSYYYVFEKCSKIRCSLR